MGIRGLKKWALLLTFWVALQTRWLHAQVISGNTVDGDLTVTGTTDINGTTLQLGSWTSGGTTYPGFYLGYSDGTTSASEFDAMRGANIWRWQQNGYATLKLQMTLDNSDILTIYNTSGTAGIALTPSSTGTSTIAGSLTVSGTDNEMPNQTLVNSHSVLTEGLGDSRYAPLSSFSIGSVSGSFYTPTGPVTTAPTLGLNGGSATGAFSFAEGNGSTASGYAATAMGHSIASGYNSTASGRYSTASGGGSTAMGWGANASGYYSTAMGYATRASGLASTALGYELNASGFFSTAMGEYSTASGYCSTAMGQQSTASGTSSMATGSSYASGNYATAMGLSTASGYYSTAMGNQTTAQAFGSVVIGQANVGLSSTGATASATSWVATDPLFEVGNGTARIASSYYYNSSTGSSYYIPPVAASLSDAFVVYKNGNAAMQGTVTAGGKITAPAFVTTAPAGDIPMYTGN